MQNPNDRSLFHPPSWTKGSVPDDHIEDKDQNAKLLNIVFQGGTFGHFLKFFLEKFSKKTPDFSFNPFYEDMGTAHKVSDEKYSGLIQKYHTRFINSNKDQTGLPVCVIAPRSDLAFLYLQGAYWYRVGNRKVSCDDLWQCDISDPKLDDIRENVDDIISNYQIVSDKIPKFVVRDWFKCEWVNPLNESYNYKWFDRFLNNDFFRLQNTHFIDMDCFFNFDQFIAGCRELDKKFGLDLDFAQIDKMREVFGFHFDKDHIKQEMIHIFELIQTMPSNTNLNIEPISVLGEAYVYAQIENRYKVSPPLSNHFFKDLAEIRSFAMNYKAVSARQVY